MSTFEYFDELTRVVADSPRRGGAGTHRSIDVGWRRDRRPGTDSSRTIWLSCRLDRASRKSVDRRCRAALSPRDLACRALLRTGPWRAPIGICSTRRLRPWDHRRGASSAANSCVSRAVCSPDTNIHIFNSWKFMFPDSIQHSTNSWNGKPHRVQQVGQKKMWQK